MPRWERPSGLVWGWPVVFSTVSPKSPSRTPTSKATRRASRVVSAADNQSLSEEGERYANEAKCSANGRLLASGGTGDAACIGPGAAEEPRRGRADGGGAPTDARGYQQRAPSPRHSRYGPHPG